MSTIYLVSASRYMDDLFEGFATDAAGIEKIVRRECLDGIRVEVDLDAQTVVAIEEDGCETTYYIHAVKLVE